MNTPAQTTDIEPVPAGYMRNAAGHLVPDAQVREQDKLRDQVARDLAEEALEINGRLAAFKEKALAEIADLVAISADRYDVNIGGRKGNVSITTFDGEYKVQRSVADRITFTEELEAAKELIDRCLKRWSEGSNNHMRVVVGRAFRANGKGQLKTTAILDLLRADIDDEEWKRAMKALTDSIQVSGTAVYVRIYKRVRDTDEYLPVPLDLAAV